MRPFRKFHNIDKDIGVPESVAARLQVLDAESAGLKARLEAIEKEQQSLLAERTVTCPGCSSTFPLRALVFKHNHHYIRPYSCTGGDYWTSSDCHEVDCLECKMPLRLLYGTGSKIDPFQAHKYFREVVKVYDRD